MNIQGTCKKSIEHNVNLEIHPTKISSDANSLSEELVGGFLFTGVPTYDQSSFNMILIEKGLA